MGQIGRAQQLIGGEGHRLISGSKTSYTVPSTVLYSTTRPAKFSAFFLLKLLSALLLDIVAPHPISNKQRTLQQPATRQTHGARYRRPFQ